MTEQTATPSTSVITLLEKWATIEPERCRKLTKNNFKSFHLVKSETSEYYCTLDKDGNLDSYNLDKILATLLQATQKYNWEAELRMYKDVRTAAIYVDALFWNPSSHEEIAIALLDAYLKALEYSRQLVSKD